MPASSHLIPEPGNLAGWILACLSQMVRHRRPALPDESRRHPHEGEGTHEGDEKNAVHGGFQFLKKQQKDIYHHEIAGQQGEIPMKE